jgi:hypothetical protein
MHEDFMRKPWVSAPEQSRAEGLCGNWSNSSNEYLLYWRRRFAQTGRSNGQHGNARVFLRLIKCFCEQFPQIDIAIFAEKASPPQGFLFKAVTEGPMKKM